MALAMLFACASASSIIDMVQHSGSHQATHSHMLLSSLSVDDHHAEDHGHAMVEHDADHDEDGAQDHLPSTHHHHSDSSSNLLAFTSPPPEHRVDGDGAYAIEQVRLMVANSSYGPDRPPKSAPTQA